MPTTHERKIIFVHIPKTGGTSIEAALGMHADKDNIGIVPYRYQRVDYHNLFGSGMQHLTVENIRDYYSGVHFESYRNIGHFKHLVDRLICMVSKNNKSVIGEKIFKSYFKFAVVRNPYDRLVSHFSWVSGFKKRTETLKKDDFINFVDRVVQNELYKSEQHLIPQHRYILIDGRVAVDKILHYENLDSEFKSLCDELRIDANLEKRMVSKQRGKYGEYYTNQTKKKVYDVYQKDFSLFGYDSEY